MRKIEFVCKKCGKKIEVQEDIYLKTYAGKDCCLSCRSGVRADDGKPKENK